MSPQHDLKIPRLAGTSRMARPGLEPGTPRFSAIAVPSILLAPGAYIGAAFSVAPSPVPWPNPLYLSQKQAPPRFARRGRRAAYRDRAPAARYRRLPVDTGGFRTEKGVFRPKPPGKIDTQACDSERIRRGADCSTRSEACSPRPPARTA